MTIHADWLSLIEVSGAFLAEPVLDIAFPQGLEGFPTHKRQTFRQTYEEWRDAQDNDDELKDQLHIEWINWVLRVGLEWDEDGSEEDLKSQIDLPESLSLSMPEHGLVIKPDYALFGDDKSKPFVIVQTYTADTDLNKVLGSDGWSTSPAERMSHLCKATGVRLGLITNGEQWMLVDAREGCITSYATWYARLWSQEPSTLKSFYSLLNISAFFNGLGLDAKKLSELLDESLKHQDEVTETLGSQVQRAVEVLIQSLDRINKDKNGELLKGVEPSELYEAGLTYMMRLVFLLCAEERGLLLLGDETYESNYAVSTLRMKLREEAGQHGEEVLGFRNNAWSRLLAVFRAVYGGIEHEELRMPALGGSLFDPDRFPFLEGRPKGSNWRIDAAHPLPIDNRTVLLFLDAIQLFQGRTLSYRALDVEQIGYVYEGLLEKTVIRADDVTLELKATQKSKTPWLKLGELASAELDGEARVLALLQERTGSSASRVKNDYNKSLEPTQSAELLLASNNNTDLRDRLLPYFHFLREDALGKPLIYAKSAFIVASGQDRRETGTHYTPKSLTEAVVKETLEPLVYEGPSVGTPREEWKLKTAEELLDLKVCDPAMGSGAFLVQVVRYLGERVCEAWEQAEADGKAVSVEGVVIETSAGEELLPLQTETEARNLIARRLVAERCIYGVDVNPLAVELAKLSIWLVTLSKGRPFGFLDHNLRSGDSLLGVHRIEQLTELSMNPAGKGQQRLFGREIEQAVKDAIELRKRIRSMPIRDIQDVNTMAALDSDARTKLYLPQLIADAFIGNVLVFGNKPKELEGAITALSVSAEQSFSSENSIIEYLMRSTQEKLSTDREREIGPRNPLHWCLEFPEVFLTDSAGFDALIGNPPFLGGKKISGVFGTSYREYLVKNIAREIRGHADLVAYFLLISANLIANNGYIGLITSNSIAEGDSRDVGLASVLQNDLKIFSAITGEVWAGKANVVTSRIHLTKTDWRGLVSLDGRPVSKISSGLNDREIVEVKKLTENSGLCYQGSVVLGVGFTLGREQATKILDRNPDWNGTVLLPYLSGKDLNSTSEHLPSRWIICFWDWEYPQCEAYQPLLDILIEQVKPERDRQKRKTYRERWWRYAELQPKVYSKTGRGQYLKKNHNDEIKHLNRVVVMATGATKYPCFTFVPNENIYANSLCVIASESYAMFACLSSDLHAVWAWEHGSRMKQDLRYTHGDVFETFPFPEGALNGSNKTLTELGERFFHERSAYMVQNNKGMTKFYNDLHDPNIETAEIESLRELQAELNHAVLCAYGFDDIDLSHGFHNVDYLPEGKNTRFTISEDAREELLYRLAMLNKAKYKAETASHQKKAATESVIKKIASDDVKQVGLFDAVPVSTPNTVASVAGNAWGTTPVDQILAWLDAKKGWYGKTAIIAGCGATESDWESAIAELIRDGDIESREIDGVTRYRAVE